MSAPSPRPPAQVEPYVRALGLEDAIRFLVEFGGAEIYHSTRPGPRSRVVEIVGAEKAVRLARLENLPARVPLAKPWIARVWRAEGLPVNEIARRLHASNVAVRRWLKAESRPGGQGDPRQSSLF